MIEALVCVALLVAAVSAGVILYRRRKRAPLEVEAPEVFGAIDTDILTPEGAQHPAQSNVDLTISSDHILPVPITGGITTLAVLAGPDVYWSDNPQVSAGGNRGTISAGSSETFTQQAWVIGSSNNRSMCRLTLLSSTTVTVGLGVGTPISDSDGGYTWGGVPVLTEAGGSYPARPNVPVILFIGPNDPAGLANNGDIWINNS
jgi:hypothetical protein